MKEQVGEARRCEKPVSLLGKLCVFHGYEIDIRAPYSLQSPSSRVFFRVVE